jgi:hypothetical protein
MVKLPAVIQPCREFPARGLILISESGRPRGIEQAIEETLLLSARAIFGKLRKVSVHYRTFIKRSAEFALEWLWLVNR